MARSERRFSPVGVLLGIFLLLIAGTTARGQSTAAGRAQGVLQAAGGRTDEEWFVRRRGSDLEARFEFKCDC